MVAPSAFTKIGLSGRKATFYKSDSSIQTLVEKIRLVKATTYHKFNHIPIPKKALEVSFAINVIIAEVTGRKKTVSIGIDNGPDIIIDADVSSTGLLGRTGLKGKTGSKESTYPQQISNDILTYSLGSDDFVELEAELIATFLTVE